MIGIPTKKINSGYIIAFFLLLVAYFLIFFTIQQLIRETGVIARSYQLLNKLQSLKAEISDAETGVRGYVITNDVNYLRSYNAATRNVPPLVSDVEQLIPENPRLGQHFASLQELVSQRMQYLSEGLTIFQMNGNRITNEMNLIQESGRTAMDSVRIYISRMNEIENNLMFQRKSKLSRFFSDTKTIAIVSLMITLFAIFYSWWTYRQESRGRQRSAREAEQYRQDLERNILELKQANTALDELKSIEKFASTGRIARTIAHEVRNPLTNISLAADQLKETEKGNDETRILLDMVSRNAARINQLVSDLLNATRFVQLDFKMVDINKVMDEALEMAEDRIRLNNVRVEKEYLEECCEVMVDEEKMKLAFLNIIVNGIEAMEKNKGVLQLKTSKSANKCVVEIKDNGSGMDEETLQRLFDPYFTAKPSGNGLGMTNTQNIILNHKGNIKAYSKPSQGTSFVISLNIAQGSLD